MLPRLVVIEPDMSTRAMLVDVLDDAGYQVHSSATAHTALGWLADQPPAAILVSLPLMDMAIEHLCQHLHTRHATAAIPVILLGTTREAPLLPSGSYAGFVAKPFLLNQLLTTVAQCL